MYLNSFNGCNAISTALVRIRQLTETPPAGEAGVVPAGVEGVLDREEDADAHQQGRLSSCCAKNKVSGHFIKSQTVLFSKAYSFFL